MESRGDLRTPKRMRSHHDTAEKIIAGRCQSRPQPDQFKNRLRYANKAARDTSHQPKRYFGLYPWRSMIEPFLNPIQEFNSRHTLVQGPNRPAGSRRWLPQLVFVRRKSDPLAEAQRMRPRVRHHQRPLRQQPAGQANKPRTDAQIGAPVEDGDNYSGWSASQISARYKPGLRGHAMPRRSAIPLSAASKQSSGALTTPAPTCPRPGSLCAMPVLIVGAMPLSTTRRISIPVGTP